MPPLLPPEPDRLASADQTQLSGGAGDSTDSKPLKTIVPLMELNIPPPTSMLPPAESYFQEPVVVDGSYYQDGSSVMPDNSYYQDAVPMSDSNYYQEVMSYDNNTASSSWAPALNEKHFEDVLNEAMAQLKQVIIRDLKKRMIESNGFRHIEPWWQSASTQSQQVSCTLRPSSSQ